MAADAEIAAALAKIYLLVGLSNIPSKLHTDLLITFLRRKFGSTKISEMEQAFIEACADALDAQPNHYQQFNSAYLGHIIKAYHRKAAAILQTLPTTQQPTALPMPPLTPKEIVQFEMDSYHPKRNIAFINPKAFDSLVSLQLAHVDELTPLLPIAKANIQAEAQSLIIKDPKSASILNQKLKDEGFIQMQAKKLFLSTWLANNKHFPQTK